MYNISLGRKFMQMFIRSYHLHINKKQKFRPTSTNLKQFCKAILKIYFSWLSMGTFDILFRYIFYTLKVV